MTWRNLSSGHGMTDNLLAGDKDGMFQILSGNPLNLV
jgi:hypothetical protein